jgi:hypothetical protein
MKKKWQSINEEAENINQLWHRKWRKLAKWRNSRQRNSHLKYQNAADSAGVISGNGENVMKMIWRNACENNEEASSCESKRKRKSTNINDNI